jgi:hypothetical protein
VISRVLCVAALALLLAACGERDRVNARDYDSFWLWAGVSAPSALKDARTIYLLDGEVRGSQPRFVPLRASVPRTRGPKVWLVVRTDTLDWSAGMIEALAPRADTWVRAGNQMEGVQIDFDARTRHLNEYADFLRHVRQSLPRRYKLSITGLMDWSANGDPRALIELKDIVDEVVIQTYQGRSTIFGYERYFAHLRGFPIPFKVGLVENGRWIEPQGLRKEPNFEGYVVFLLPNAPGTADGHLPWPGS